MKKVIYIIVLVLLASVATKAQVRITYDQAGNRIRYQLLVEPLPDTMSVQSIQQNNPAVKQSSLENANISVYPNPTNDQLLIDTKQEGSYTVLLYDMQGKLVREEKSANAKHTVDLNSFQTGYYFLEINTGKQSTKWKVMKY